MNSLTASSRKLAAALALGLAGVAAHAADPIGISGILPDLAMFNNEGECGTGAIVPWADRLWVITYGPHLPYGSSDKLYEITPELKQIVRPESVGGTPADRMIHSESQQLIIGPYFIDAQRNVRVVQPKNMPGRLTAVARHLTDPANKVYFATMEEGLYEVNVHTLEVTGLIKDNNIPKPGQTSVAHPATIVTGLTGSHGKGLYSGQGELFYANNGQHQRHMLGDRNETARQRFPETISGALAKWDTPGTDWTLVRQNQFAEITGPGGVMGNQHPATDPVWAVGWDFRSVILNCYDQGSWHTYRLPKASNTYDASHGYYTEWFRIRDIGEKDFLMNAQGEFFHFPANFSVAHSGGIIPASSYLKIVADFARFGDYVVLGGDDAGANELTRRIKGPLAVTGQSQSNLQFLTPAGLDSMGPSLGRGAVWMDESVKTGDATDPYLFAGYAERSLEVTQDGADPMPVTIEVDVDGTDHWTKLRDIVVPPYGTTWTAFGPEEKGAWVRLVAGHNEASVNAVFHYRATDSRAAEPTSLFAGLIKPGDTAYSGGLLHPAGNNARTLQVIAADGKVASYVLGSDLKLRAVNDPESVTWAKTHLAIPRDFLTADAASVVCVEGGRRWRLPKGDAAFEQPGSSDDERVDREVTTERDLFNAYGTFYELPAETAGGFAKIRPIATHNRRIKDYASYRGLTVISGIENDAAPSTHLIRSDDGKCALWVGAVDDLWQLGKPRGHGGPWMNSTVLANEPSDPYLASGYDQKKLTLSQSGSDTVTFTLQADYFGMGEWNDVAKFEVKPGETKEYEFPSAFGAYWLRLVPSAQTVATAQFEYR